MCKRLGPVRIRHSKYPLLLLLLIMRPNDPRWNERLKVLFCHITNEECKPTDPVCPLLSLTVRSQWVCLVSQSRQPVTSASVSQSRQPVSSASLVSPQLCSLCHYHQTMMSCSNTWHKGVNQRSKDVTQVQQQRPESPTGNSYLACV